FTGEIRGSDRLVEQELAKKLGVSRTPVREALFELAAIGLIRLRPKLGVTVRDFGATQIREIYQIRRLLECEATRLCAGRIDEALLRQIRDETQALLAAQAPGESWSRQAMALDDVFHESISANSGSERLAEEIERYRTLV